MTQLLNFASFLPTALFFTFWIAFPVWLALRRSQGLIRIERTNQEGEREQIGMHLELGVFIFAIPFTTFFFFVVIYPLISSIITDPGVRFQKSLDASFMLIAIFLFLYIYLAERKIYLRELKGRNGVKEDEDQS
jgi:hypothetical protein